MITIDLVSDFFITNFLNIAYVPSTIGSGYELPTRNSEEP